MIKDFRKTENLKKIKNGQFSFFDILQLPYTVISNSEKLTHPSTYMENRVRRSEIRVHKTEIRILGI